MARAAVCRNGCVLKTEDGSLMKVFPKLLKDVLSVQISTSKIHLQNTLSWEVFRLHSSPFKVLPCWVKSW